MTPDDLVEMEQIKRLKYRYVRCLDTKDWDGVASCLAADAAASYGGGAYTFEGREEIIGFLRRNMDDTAMLTSHKVHQPEIEITGPDTATATWALEDVVVHTGYGITVRGAAFYSDEYVKVDGEWLIRRTGYRRVYEELEPRPDGVQLTASWWGTGGRSSLPVR